VHSVQARGVTELIQTVEMESKNLYKGLKKFAFLKNDGLR